MIVVVLRIFSSLVLATIPLYQANNRNYIATLTTITITTVKIDGLATKSLFVGSGLGIRKKAGIVSILRDQRNMSLKTFSVSLMDKNKLFL